MSRLQIVEIQDPYEFAKKIQINQTENLYVYIDGIFKPNPKIYEKVIDLYEKYSCGIMFTDITTTYDNYTSNQYFSDMNVLDQKVIYSPLIIKYLPISLQIYSDLKYHSFSFLKQISKLVVPWHVPYLGFHTTMNQNQFKRFTEDSQWVLQHVT